MATYCGQNYGAGRPERIRSGVKAACGMMLAYSAFMAVILWSTSEDFALLFIAPGETEVLGLTSRFLHVSVSFFPVLGLLCILRYSIQGAGFTRLALWSGVSEMIARILVSKLAVPIWAYWAICFGDPTAWVFAVAFLIPAFLHINKKLHRLTARVDNMCQT